jgi:acetyl-CoA C-acetyltransferase
MDCSIRERSPAFHVARPSTLNEGAAMALGHPIGATGAILLGTLLDELGRRDLSRGLVTLCAAAAWRHA